MFKNIAPDKKKHFLVGIAMGIVLQPLGSWLLASWPVWAILVPLFIIISISYGFELFSKITGKGHYEVMDAVASILGGVLGMGIILVFSYLS